MKILWTDESVKWLREIHQYISKDSRRTADRVINEIIKRTEVLKDFPEIGQRLEDWQNEDIRMILYGHYRIIYFIVNKERIDILGVYHGALDLKKYLKKL